MNVIELRSLNDKGTFNIQRHDNCKFDVEEVCRVLNEYKWDSNGGKWALNKTTGELDFSNDQAKNATLFPKKIICYLVCRGSSKQWILAKNIRSEEFKNVVAIEEEQVSLEELVANISPLIEAGSIYFGLSGVRGEFDVLQDLKISFDKNGWQAEELIRSKGDMYCFDEHVVNGRSVKVHFRSED